MQTITPMQEKKEKLSAMQLCDFCAQTAAMLHSGCSLEDACAALILLTASLYRITVRKESKDLYFQIRF